MRDRHSLGHGFDLLVFLEVLILVVFSCFPEGLCSWRPVFLEACVPGIFDIGVVFLFS